MKKLLFFISFLLGSSSFMMAQNPLQYFKSYDQSGINSFETSKMDTVDYDGFKVRVGGAFAMQFQGLDHSNTNDDLIVLGSNFNLPTANLNLDVQMADGVRLHMKTYLSSRHHPEAWVKGGHLQIDKLDFVKEDFLSGLMEKMTFKIGLDEINYGDAHFRRSDNAQVIHNPFVGNYIIDGFTTEAFGEFYYQHNGLIAMLGISNGKLNQSVVKGSDDVSNDPSIYAKLGYDKQIDQDLRLRLTGSFYTNSGDQSIFLYNGDRASSRYYHVMDDANGGSDWSGRLTFTVPEVTSFMINPFVRYKGLEFFGMFESVSATNFAGNDVSYTQIGAEALYRFGENDDFYLGGRYNAVTGSDAADDQDITRINIGGGWFMTQNILAKLEFVDQKYEGDGWGGRFAGGEFNGIVLEAVISF